MILTWITVLQCNLIICEGILLHIQTHTCSNNSKAKTKLKYILVFSNVGVSLQMPINSLYFKLFSESK